MAHDAHQSSATTRQARAPRLAIDLIIDCEQAAMRCDPRHCDPAPWNREGVGALSLCRGSCAEPRRSGAALPTSAGLLNRQAPELAIANAKVLTNPHRSQDLCHVAIFLLVMNADTRIEALLYILSVRAPSQRTPSDRSIRTSQWTDGVLGNPRDLPVAP